MDNERAKELSVIIPSWNGKDLLEDCLRSLTQNMPKFPAEIIVADNGSRDGTAQFLEKTYPEVKILRFEKNLGFTPAVNAGIKASSGRYVLVLNNDIIVLKGAIEKLVDFMNDNSRVGISTSRLFYSDGSVQPVFYKYRTIPFTLAETFFMDRMFPLTGIYGNRDGKPEKRETTTREGWVMGAAMMFRRVVIDETGGFDENSFTGDEDICFEAKNKGWEIALCRDAAMIHSHRQSSFSSARNLESEWMGRMYFEFQRSACLSYIKRNPLWKGKTLFLIKKSASFLRLMISSALYLLSVGNEDILKARVKGHFTFLCSPFEEMAKYADTVFPKKITVVSPSLLVKGGISQQVKFLFESEFAEKYRFNHAVTHIGGNKIEKFAIAIKGAFGFFIQSLFNPPHLVVIYMSGDVSFLRKSVILLISKMRRIRTILYCHSYDFDSFYLRSPNFLKRYIEYILKKSDFVIALSQFWRNALASISKRKDIIVVPPFSDEIEKFLSIPLNEKNEKPCHILFMGAIEKRKGVFDLIEAFSEVLKKSGDDCHLTLAGEGNIREIEKIIEEKGLSKRITLAGWADSEAKKKLFSENGIFVLPSYAEGFPLVILEAMAGGLSVIAGNAGGIKDLIKSGENGFLVEPGNITMLENLLLRLLADPNLRKKISENARSLVSEKYRIDASMKVLENVFEKALS